MIANVTIAGRSKPILNCDIAAIIYKTANKSGIEAKNKSAIEHSPLIIKSAL